MKNVILKILKEGDLDWIQNTPSFLEVLGPVSNRNPKDAFRLHFNLGYGEDSARWSSDWAQFNNNTKSLNNLRRLIRIFDFVNNQGRINNSELAERFVDGATWIGEPWLDDWERNTDEGNSREDLIELATQWISEDLRDWGIFDFDDYTGDLATIEDWKVTYFDKDGVEHVVKVNNA